MIVIGFHNFGKDEGVDGSPGEGVFAGGISFRKSSYRPALFQEQVSKTLGKRPRKGSDFHGAAFLRRHKTLICKPTL